MQWYYVDGENRVGPLDDNEFNELIYAKEITSETLVWREGMTDWQELGTLNTGDSDDLPDDLSVKELVCSQCLNTFPEEDLITYERFLVCAACKPAFFQKVKEGVPITSAEPSERYGSLGKGLRGEYNFRISEVLKEAWGLTKGTKRYVVAGTVIMYSITFALKFIAGHLIKNTDSTGLIYGIQALYQFISMAVTYPLSAGIMMIGIRRSVGLSISFSSIFSYFGRIVSLFIANILQMIFLVIGFFLLVIPFIYLSVAYCLAIALIVDKNFGPWRALETSRKAVTHRWFKIAVLGFIIMLIISLSVIPMFVGFVWISISAISKYIGFIWISISAVPLIWTLPMTVTAYGILYRNVFGVEAAKE